MAGHASEKLEISFGFPRLLPWSSMSTSDLRFSTPFLPTKSRRPRRLGFLTGRPEEVRGALTQGGGSCDRNPPRGGVLTCKQRQHHSPPTTQGTAPRKPQKPQKRSSHCVSASCLPWEPCPLSTSFLVERLVSKPETFRSPPRLSQRTRHRGTLSKHGRVCVRPYSNTQQCACFLRSGEEPPPEGAAWPHWPHGHLRACWKAPGSWWRTPASHHSSAAPTSS